jgi:D-glycero-D-manno-heptose 1,7-bisphosphate phosphatase
MEDSRAASRLHEGTDAMNADFRGSGETRGFPGLLLDRDGTLCEEVGYLDSPDRLRLIEGASTALRLARAAGFRIAIVTNQSGVARGLFDLETVQRIHEKLRDMLECDGSRIDAAFTCPHHPQFGDDPTGADCGCRKPAPGLLLRAARELDLNLSASYTIGDRYRDLLAGARAGTRTILVRTGYGSREFRYHPDHEEVQPDHVAENLLDAVKWILRQDPQGDDSVGPGAK